MNEKPPIRGMIITIDGIIISMDDWDMLTNPIQIPRADKEENEPKETKL